MFPFTNPTILETGLTSLKGTLMLRYLTTDQLAAYPVLRDTMHRDLTAQFRDWLKWDVTVDADGFERDKYDAMNPLYVIWEMPSGRHGGSMRFLPTSGRTMVHDHFPSFLRHIKPYRAIRAYRAQTYCLSGYAPCTRMTPVQGPRVVKIPVANCNTAFTRRLPIGF